jgi:phosphinothricin acetyltransferase
MTRHVKITDAGQICAIYNHYIINTTATFEEEEITEEEMRIRIKQLTRRFPWLVCEVENEIKGYAYATDWKSRSAYRYSAETTVYLKSDYLGKGIGSILYQELIKEMKSLSYQTLIGGIALPNNSSIALHEKMNFKKVAHFQQIGFKLNQWIDVGYWQLLLKPDSLL